MYDERQLIKDIRAIAAQSPVDDVSAKLPPEVDLARTRLQSLDGLEVVEFIARRSRLNGLMLFDPESPPTNNGS